MIIAINNDFWTETDFSYQKYNGTRYAWPPGCKIILVSPKNNKSYIPVPPQLIDNSQSKEKHIKTMLNQALPDALVRYGPNLYIHLFDVVGVGAIGIAFYSTKLEIATELYSI